MRVFITGASSGLGRALAARYAARGAILGLVARRTSELDEFCSLGPARCSVYSLDVREATLFQHAAAAFLSRYGCPDIVIANAGVSIGTDPGCAEDLQVLRDVVDTNLIGLANTFQPFIGAMRAAGKGTLTGIASVAGYRGLPGAGAYCASKAAAISYLESMRAELCDSGVRVLTVCPGYIATPMTVHNAYAMPFIMSADQAAAKVIGSIERGRSYSIIPWQMAVVARVLRLLPNALYDRLAAGAPRKARRAP